MVGDSPGLAGGAEIVVPDRGSRDGPGRASAGETVGEWRPGKRATSMWLIGLLPAVVVGWCLFGAVAALPHGGSVIVTGGTAEILLTLALSLGLMIVHEGVHGLAMLAVGVRPSFGWGMVERVCPVLYTTAGGATFTRRQYVGVALAPTVLISLAGLPLCLAPFGVWLILPLALNFAGGIGDWTLVAVVLRQPPDILFEDRRDSVGFVRPARSGEANPARGHGRDAES